MQVMEASVSNLDVVLRELRSNGRVWQEKNGVRFTLG